MGAANGTAGDPSGSGSGSGSGGPVSALPSVGARVLAFVAVLVGGFAGATIGYAFGDLSGASEVAHGVFLLVGAVLAAGGVAVVAVLTLRALGEWETVRNQSP